jgi:hypothetical protein
MASYQHIDNPDRQIDRQHSSFLLTSIYISKQEHRLPILLYPSFLKGKSSPSTNYRIASKEPNITNADRKVERKEQIKPPTSTKRKCIVPPEA